MSPAIGARSVAAVFLVAGILGFIPGITTHFGDLHFAGHSSHAELLGVFRVSILLNLVHVLVGALGVVVARTTDIAVASLGLWLLGVFAAGGWLPLDTADNWLHFVLGLAVLGVGQVTARPAMA